MWCRATEVNKQYKTFLIRLFTSHTNTTQCALVLPTNCLFIASIIFPHIHQKWTKLILAPCKVKELYKNSTQTFYGLGRVYKYIGCQHQCPHYTFIGTLCSPRQGLLYRYTAYQYLYEMSVRCASES